MPQKLLLNKAVLHERPDYKKLIFFVSKLPLSHTYPQPRTNLLLPVKEGTKKVVPYI